MQLLLQLYKLYKEHKESWIASGAGKVQQEEWALKYAEQLQQQLGILLIGHSSNACAGGPPWHWRKFGQSLPNDQSSKCTESLRW